MILAVWLSLCDTAPGQVRLIMRRVYKAISKKTRNINGAGDAFATGIILDEVSGKKSGNVVELTLRASETAIRYIGYQGDLPKDAFIVKEIGVSGNSIAK